MIWENVAKYRSLIAFAMVTIVMAILVRLILSTSAETKLTYLIVLTSFIVITVGTIGSRLDFASSKYFLPLGITIAVVAVLILTSIYFVYGSLDPSPKNFHECKEAERILNLSNDNTDVNLSPGLLRYNLICAIKNVDGWYLKNARINQLFFSYGTLAVIVLSFTTALFVAADFAKKSEGWRIATIALPLLSTAVAAITSQFHFQDSWELRETGRIEAEILLARIEALSPKDQKFDETFTGIRNDLLSLEKSQASRYFAYRFAAAPEKQNGTPKPTP